MNSKVKSSAVTGGGASLVPNVRFPEFQELVGWKEVSLQKLARPVTDKATTGDADNVLSLSGEHGLVLQRDYFGKKIAGDSTDRYLKIRKDDFVYNDRTTKASSFGTIKRLSKYSAGIVSPIYKCFRFQPSETPAFWEWYFESGSHDEALGGWQMRVPERAASIFPSLNFCRQRYGDLTKPNNERSPTAWMQRTR